MKGGEQRQTETELEVEERRCLICMPEEIEDESHFVIDCAFYDDLREKFKMKERIIVEERKRGRQEAADATTSRNPTTRREQAGGGALCQRRAVFCGWTKEFEEFFWLFR